MRPLLLALCLLLAPALAQAAERMFTYDAASPRAKALTGAGLTLTLRQGLLGEGRLLTVQATAVPVVVEVAPADRKDEAGLRRELPSQANGAAIYEVVRSAQQGEVLSRAFCSGASRVWLAVSPVRYGKPLTVWALGDGGVAGKTLRLCDEMDFAWRGEWRLPEKRPPPRIGSPSLGRAL